MLTPSDIIIRASNIECNKHCADCGRSTLIAGCNVDTKHSIFICTSCAKIHRELFYLIKSLNDQFTPEEAMPFQYHTNDDFNKIWMAKWSESDIPLPQIADDETRRKFIIEKYFDKKWYSEIIPLENFTQQQQKSNPRDIFSNFDPLSPNTKAPKQELESHNSAQINQSKYIQPQQINGNKQYNSIGLQGQIYPSQYYSNYPYRANTANYQNIQQQNAIQQHQELMQPLNQSGSYGGFLNYLQQQPQQFAYNANSFDQLYYQQQRQQAIHNAPNYQRQQIDQQNNSHENMYININNGSFDPKTNNKINSTQAKQTKNSFNTLDPFDKDDHESLQKTKQNNSDDFEYKNNLEKQLSNQSKEIEKLNKIIEDQKNQLLMLSNENKKLQQHIKGQNFIIHYFEEEEQQQKQSNQQQPKNQFEILDSETIKTIKKINELGRGASSIVYKVSRPISRDEIYVLKEMTLLNHSNLQNFIKEYEILNMLNHPNVLKTFGIFLSDEKTPASILLEYCTNDIGKAIKDKLLSKVDIVFSIYQIAQGMKYIHSNNIIHRDLKPSNIFIANDGTIKIADFGISKIMSADEQQTSMTGNIGTLYFMAPEIMNGEKYDSKVDVYSFGVLIFFILNDGVMPKLSLKQIIVGDKIDYPKFFTDFSKKLIDKCWNIDPNVRPNFASICEEIENNNFHLLDLSFLENQELKLKVRQMKKKISSIYT